VVFWQREGHFPTLLPGRVDATDLHDYVAQVDSAHLLSTFDLIWQQHVLIICLVTLSCGASECVGAGGGTRPCFRRWCRHSRRRQVTWSLCSRGARVQHPALGAPGSDRIPTVTLGTYCSAREHVRVSWPEIRRLRLGALLASCPLPQQLGVRLPDRSLHER
jgi:hypothetical protein